MDDEIKSWLFDILNSIHEIEGYFAATPKIFESYKNDLKTKRAIERNIEIIGEAVNRILKKNADIQITNARKIVDTRNQIAHGYEKVSDDVIWAIVINHLPKLKLEIDKFFID